MACELFKKDHKVYYYQDKREVDFIVNDLGIEVKWQSKIIKDDFKQLLKFKKGLVVSKNDFYEEENVKIIPLELFLLMESGIRV